MYEAMGLIFFHSVGALGKSICFFTMPFWKSVFKPWTIPASWRGCATHVATWFRDVHGRVVYFEALEGEGFRGPIELKKAHEWEAKKAGRWVHEFDLTRYLGMTPEQITRRFEYAESMLDVWKYNTPQLLIMPRTMGVGRKLIPASPNDVICSEAASRLCKTDTLDFRELCNKEHHDHISPNDLLIAVKKLLSRTVVADERREVLNEKD